MGKVLNHVLLLLDIGQIVGFVSGWVEEIIVFFQKIVKAIFSYKK